MSIWKILLIVLLLVLVLGGLPQAGWHHYGYGPSGGLGLLLVVVVLIIFGVL